jgi:DHA1 family multidrug resistance protein-like MFS transporter
MLYGARMLNGVFSAAVLPIASAYIVDVTPLEFRARGLAWHGTSVGLGLVSGPAVASFVSELVKNHPLHLSFIDFNAFSAPFLLASVLSGFSVILAGVWLQESYPGENNKSLPNTDTNLLSGQEPYVKQTIRVLLLLAFISQFGLSLFEGTFVLHAQNVMTISPLQLGYVFMVCGFVMAAAQGTVVASFIEKFSAKKVLPFGFVFMGIGLMMLMFGRSISAVLVLVGVLAMGMAINTPSIAVIMSSYTEGKIGKSLGLLAGVTSLGQTLGPLLGSLLFVINIHLPYLLSAAALLMAATYIFMQNRVTQEQVGVG